jgi:hypothetical protein
MPLDLTAEGERQQQQHLFCFQCTADFDDSHDDIMKLNLKKSNDFFL